jgi:excisionase family DNA binding protein
MMPGEQYLTIAEVAKALKLSPKTVKNKMASGSFRQGVHYFRPPGMHARFKWSAVQAWMEQSDEPSVSKASPPCTEGIPMARGYTLPFFS